MSQAELEIIFDFLGTGKVVKGEIARFQAPLTIQRLMDTSPITTRMRYNIGSTKTYLMLLLTIKKGMEKEATKHPEVGDILYCPQQDAIFVVFKPTKFSISVKFLGKITEGLSELEEIPLGTNVKINVKEKL
jgi:hypothetical protein